MSSLVVGVLWLRAMRKAASDQHVASVASLSGLDFSRAQNEAFPAAGPFASTAVGKSLLLFLLGLLFPMLYTAKGSLVSFSHPFKNNSNNCNIRSPILDWTANGPSQKVQVCSRWGFPGTWLYFDGLKQGGALHGTCQVPELSLSYPGRWENSSYTLLQSDTSQTPPRALVFAPVRGMLWLQLHSAWARRTICPFTSLQGNEETLYWV